MAEPFSIPLRVYYEDTDAGGVVYYANYLRFIERARSEWLRAHGVPIDYIERAFNVVFVVHHLDAHYRAPARLMDELTATVAITEMRRVQFTATQRVLRGAEPLFEAQVTLACLDRATFKPASIPTDIKNIANSL